MGHSLDPLDERNTARGNARNDARTDSTAFGASGSSSGLRALSDLDDLDIAEGEPDIRGWDVRDSAGDRIGEVDDLIIDMTAMKVRYMAVELDKEFFSLDDTRRVLVPIGNAQLDDDDDDVIITATRESLLAMPAYDDDTFTDEQSTHDQFARPWSTGSAAAASTAATTGSTSTGRDDLYKNEQFDDKNFFGTRRGQDRQDQSYLRRDEEKMRMEKSDPSAIDKLVDEDLHRDRLDVDDTTRTQHGHRSDIIDPDRRP